MCVYKSIGAFTVTASSIQLTQPFRSNMQSTVRSSAPRPLLDEFGRHDSSNSIQIDQEVSVISHRKDSLKPTTAPKHLRPQSQGANVTVTAPQLSRWNSDSRTSNTSRGSSRYPARPQARRIMSAEVDSLESNRESMKALAEFLRTKVCIDMVIYDYDANKG